MKKTNKTFKRFAAITSASLLAACAVAPVFTSMTSFAATNNFALSTPSNLPADSTIDNIQAFKIFECELTESGAFNVVDWATGVTPESLGFEAETSAAAAAEIINDYNNLELEALAKKAATALTTGGIKAESYADGVVKFATDLEIGYYVVVCDVTNSNGDEYDAKSLGMLTVTGRGSDTQIGLGTAKVGLPTVEKKVKEDQEANYAADSATHETSDKSWNDVADYDIGDAVPFKLYGTMPQNLDKYDAYYYCFKDTLDSQFDSAKNVVVKIDGVAVEQGENLVVDVSGQNLTVSFKDIKTAADNITKDSIVTVEYTAVLNTTAVVGNPGQNNEVYLEYSNNPNFDYNPWDESEENDTPEKGETPKDIVNVLTYAFELEKTFFDAAGEPIDFELYKENENGENVYVGPSFELSSNGGELWFAPIEDENYDYVVVQPGTTGATQDLVLTDVAGEFLIRIKGLDEGTYTLSETSVPTGFNQAANQEIVITADTANGQTWNGATATLSGFSWTIDGTEAGNQIGDTIDATATAEMQNRQGTSLPGTGGIGTTIFYLGGGAMAAIGGVYLVSKRRMKKSEE